MILPETLSMSATIASRQNKEVGISPGGCIIPRQQPAAMQADYFARLQRGGSPDKTLPPILRGASIGKSDIRFGWAGEDNMWGKWRQLIVVVVGYLVVY